MMMVAYYLGWVMTNTWLIAPGITHIHQFLWVLTLSLVMMVHDDSCWLMNIFLDNWLINIIHNLIIVACLINEVDDRWDRISTMVDDGQYWLILPVDEDKLVESKSWLCMQISHKRWWLLMLAKDNGWWCLIFAGYWQWQICVFDCCVQSIPVGKLIIWRQEIEPFLMTFLFMIEPFFIATSDDRRAMIIFCWWVTVTRKCLIGVHNGWHWDWYLELRYLSMNVDFRDWQMWIAKMNGEDMWTGSLRTRDKMRSTG